MTGAGSGEGKSTTTLNLSYMLAEAGERVLLIEGDMRLPAISRLLKLQPAPGLSNVLAGLCGIKETLQESGVHDRLQVISAGEVPPNPSELLGAKSIDILIEVLSGDYDFILFDLPPVTDVADALVAEIRALHNRPGCTVVLAHIERNLRYQKKTVWDKLLEAGILMQSNASFFLQWSTKHKAVHMLDAGRIHLLGSDCHNMAERPPRVGEDLAQIGDRRVRMLERRCRMLLEPEEAAV